MTPTLIVMVHRQLSVPTFMSTMQQDYAIQIETGDALICRARSIAATKWMHYTESDVAIMTDDDF